MTVPTLAWAHLPLEALYALRRQLQNEESAIADKAVVRRRCYRDAVVEEWGVLNCVALEALGVEFEHREGGCVRPSAVMMSPAFPRTHMSFVWSLEAACSLDHVWRKNQEVQLCGGREMRARMRAAQIDVAGHQ